MAELGLSVAGSAIGVVALAGLFTTCVDCFERIQLGRDYSRDFAIAETKFEAQQLRLMIWGRAFGIVGEMPYNTRLDHPTVRPVIERSFQTLKMLFDDNSKLSKNYGLRLSYSRPERNRRPIFREAYDRFQKDILRRQTQASFALKANWAIQNRAKFLSLVQDITEILDALESITNSLDRLAQQEILMTEEIACIDDTSNLELIRDAVSDHCSRMSETASLRLSLLQQIPGAYPKSLSTTKSDYTDTMFTAIEEQPQNETSTAAVTSYQDDAEVSRSSMQTSGAPLHPSIAGLAERNRRAGITNWRSRDDTLFLAVSPSEARARDRKICVNRSTISQELRWISAEANPDEIGIEPIVHDWAEDYNDLLGYFFGPEGTAYEGGIFHVRFHIPWDYPYKPPTCKFLTRIYHPNIDCRGRICISTLGEDWSSANWLGSTLMSICSMLDDPVVDDPLVPEIAEQYIRDPKEYRRIARRYTERYATGDVPPLTKKGPDGKPWYEGLTIERN